MGGRHCGLPSGAAGSGRPAAPEEACEDARTFPIMRNSVGERLRDMRAAAEQLTVVEFED
jgi:hypothetical protein